MPQHPLILILNSPARQGGAYRRAKLSPAVASRPAPPYSAAMAMSPRLLSTTTGVSKKRTSGSAP